MLQRRRLWLERLANWATALAVPVVAIVGFKLLSHARDGAEPLAMPRPAPPGKVLAPPIDASAPPVVDLRPPQATAGDGPRCAALRREIGELDAQAASGSGAGTLAATRERRASLSAESRAGRCPDR